MRHGLVRAGADVGQAGRSGKAQRHATRGVRLAAIAWAAASLFAGCGMGETKTLQVAASESCMQCHNASLDDDYSGPGIENPHPFPGADSLKCTTCHGGNPDGSDAHASHVPPPPEIGDEQKQTHDREAWFNRLTLTGIDRYADYTVDGQTYSALDYLQFVNPGDLRVVTAGRACGQCHSGHADCVESSVLATATGMFSGAMFAAGVENAVPESVGLHQDTAADLAFRAVVDFDYVPGAGDVGDVGRLLEFPVYAKSGANAIKDNPEYRALALADDVTADNRLISGSPLADLYHEQVAFTCGDCHLGSAGANNRAGDFRSSGCTACHMPYSLGGRSGSQDPNVDKYEPADPDDIDPPERAHVRAHRIASTYKILNTGEVIRGIDDLACAGCHQGSNRTVMQYWGIRLDQNQDVRQNRQYPANPVSWKSTKDDTRLFDPALGNKTFNGRNANQYLAFEDYDGDGRDDTPADVHHEAGMGCIDCHGSFDLHGGDVTNPVTSIASRMEQAVAIRCESCHGSAAAYAATTSGIAFDGTQQELAVDGRGHALDHVVKEADGYWLTSRLTGARHYVRQTRDVVVDGGQTHPTTGEPLYSAKASFAMGRADGDPATGLGPQQTGGVTPGFSHGDNMDCAACHSAWTNTCMGCHLVGEYNTGNNFSNITGERIVFREKDADFVYQSPVPFQLGVGPHNEITQFSANTKVFFSYEDQQNDRSDVFAFSDRRGQGNSSPYGALAHNAMMAHSIRGKVTPTDEGPRYCAACHLTEDGLASYGAEYDAFRQALAANDYAALDFDLLEEHIGRNTGNTLESPIWVHMVAGLGSGVFLFDEDGGPLNPLDTFNGRKGSGGVAPATKWGNVPIVFDLDRVVTSTGQSTASSTHALLEPGVGPDLRDGAADPAMAGPLGLTLIQRLTDPLHGIVLDAWIDADGVLRGDAPAIVQEP